MLNKTIDVRIRQLQYPVDADIVTWLDHCCCTAALLWEITLWDPCWSIQMETRSHVMSTRESAWNWDMATGIGPLPGVMLYNGPCIQYRYEKSILSHPYVPKKGQGTSRTNIHSKYCMGILWKEPLSPGMEAWWLFLQDKCSLWTVTSDQVRRVRLEHLHQL